MCAVPIVTAGSLDAFGAKRVLPVQESGFSGREFGTYYSEVQTGVQDLSAIGVKGNLSSKGDKAYNR